MGRPRTGWYRLPGSGQLYHGAIPTGVAEIVEPPPSGDEVVEAGESDAPVGAEVAGVDLASDPLEVGDGPVAADPAGEDETDVDTQEPKPTPRRKGGRS